MKNEAEIILEASGLKKSFAEAGERLEIIRDASLTVSAGESVSIRGESGSGKSTLLNLLAGLDVADAGSLKWGGGAEMGAEGRRKFLGMVFQSFYLIPELTALENVLMAARVAGKCGSAEKRRARELLERVGLGERLTHVPSKLSGGECQRVAVARALMNGPRLLLADEPTGNLDEKSGDGVIDLLMGICAETGTALVLVTHSAVHAGRAGRRYWLHEGRLAEVKE